MDPVQNRIALVLFAAAILFSVVREWRMPVSCPRLSTQQSR